MLFVASVTLIKHPGFNFKIWFLKDSPVADGFH